MRTMPRLLCASAKSGLRAIARSKRATAWSSLPCSAKDVAQIVVRLGKIRPESDRLLEAGRCLVELALVLENVAQVVVRLEEVWV